MAVRDTFDTLRQPEYTGANRCTPCTIVNLGIAAVAAGAIALVSPALGVLAFAAFAAVIYLRGYLVPGTPALTKRYLPDEVLRRFDKEPTTDVALGVDVDPDEDLDPEETLVSVGALEPTADGDDLQLTPEFAVEWREQVGRIREGTAPRDELAALLGVDESRVAFDANGRSLVATVDDERVGQWPSRAALIADLAGDAALAERTPAWTDLPVERRSALLGSLRVFHRECPECNGPVELDEESRESCCRSWEVLAVSCRDCGSRLFEIEAAEVEPSAE